MSTLPCKKPLGDLLDRGRERGWSLSRALRRATRTSLDRGRLRHGQHLADVCQGELARRRIAQASGVLPPRRRPSANNSFSLARCSASGADPARRRSWPKRSSSCRGPPGHAQRRGASPRLGQTQRRRPLAAFRRRPFVVIDRLDIATPKSRRTRLPRPRRCADRGRRPLQAVADIVTAEQTRPGGCRSIPRSQINPVSGLASMATQCSGIAGGRPSTGSST